MLTNEFSQFVDNFKQANLNKKIELYSTTPNLTNGQYRTLLRLFQPSEIHALEKALS